jgi:hypothetical protein
MAKFRLGKKSSRKGAAFSRTVIAIAIGVIALASIVVFSMGSKSSVSVYASQKRYKGTRPIVVDQQTGQRRLPNQAEIDEVVANLSQLASRPEDLSQTQIANGAVTVDLAGGYGGVMLGRPNEDGTWETKCVFTFQEGADFLGLVEDNSTE